MILGILKNLQKELSTFFICIAIASVMIVVSNSWWQTSYNNKQLAEADLNEARERYFTAINQKKILKLFEDKYIHLQKSGIVGDENRLNWVDTIEKITAENKIPYLKYKINKRQLVDSNELKQNYPQVALFKSIMTLQMQLLHEGDLYTIINSLDKKALGLFDIKSCSITRNTTQTESLLESVTDKNFSAKCELNWYTLQKSIAAIPTEENY